MLVVVLVLVEEQLGSCVDDGDGTVLLVVLVKPHHLGININ